MSATLVNATFASLPTNTGTLEQNHATGPCDATTAIHAPARRVLLHGADGKWYSCDSLPTNLQLPLQEISADDASQWYQARTQARPSTTEIRHCFKRIAKEWLLQYGTAAGSVKDSKGMRYIQELLSRPHKPIAATTLARLDATDEPGSSVLPDEVDDEGRPLVGMGGSKDFILDDETIGQYRRQMKQLAKQIQEARENYDEEAVSRLQAQLYFYADDLRKNTKKGNKPKRFAAGDDSEKARSAVTHAMRRAFQAIRNSDTSLQPLCDYLQSHIETGVECVYRPGGERISWEV